MLLPSGEATHREIGPYLQDSCRNSRKDFRKMGAGGRNADYALLMEVRLPSQQRFEAHVAITETPDNPRFERVLPLKFL
jgi:hypothetical protein